MTITYTKGDTVNREEVIEQLIHATHPDGNLTLSEAVAAVRKVNAVTKGDRTVTLDLRTGSARTTEEKTEETDEQGR